MVRLRLFRTWTVHTNGHRGMSTLSIGWPLSVYILHTTTKQRGWGNIVTRARGHVNCLSRRLFADCCTSFDLVLIAIVPLCPFPPPPFSYVAQPFYVLQTLCSTLPFVPFPELTHTDTDSRSLIPLLCARTI